MQVYILEIKGELGNFVFDAVYTNKQDALNNVNFWEIPEDSYRITVHEV